MRQEYAEALQCGTVSFCGTPYPLNMEPDGEEWLEWILTREAGTNLVRSAQTTQRPRAEPDDEEFKVQKATKLAKTPWTSSQDPLATATKLADPRRRRVAASEAYRCTRCPLCGTSVITNSSGKHRCPSAEVSSLIPKAQPKSNTSAKGARARPAGESSTSDTFTRFTLFFPFDLWEHPSLPSSLRLSRDPLPAGWRAEDAVEVLQRNVKLVQDLWPLVDVHELESHSLGDLLLPVSSPAGAESSSRQAESMPSFVLEAADRAAAADCHEGFLVRQALFKLAVSQSGQDDQTASQTASTYGSVEHDDRFWSDSRNLTPFLKHVISAPRESFSHSFRPTMAMPSSAADAIGTQKQVQKLAKRDVKFKSYQRLPKEAVRRALVASFVFEGVEGARGLREDWSTEATERVRGLRGGGSHTGKGKARAMEHDEDGEDGKLEEAAGPSGKMGTPDPLSAVAVDKEKNVHWLWSWEGEG